MENLEILAIHDGTRERQSVPLSEEVPLTIEVNGQEIATLLCSPSDADDLVKGFLYTSGIIPEISAVQGLVIDRERFKANVDIEGSLDDLVFRRVYTSGCGKGVIFHNTLDLMQRVRIEEGFTIAPVEIARLMQAFLRGSPEHAWTRGVHSAALAAREEILIFRDDIGRHNALDKVVGAALAQGIDYADKIILTTGRVSSEILSKAMRCRMPVIAALGAPTNQAVKFARMVNLTLVGLVRGGRMNVYSGGERIQS
jgi:FdhD protein